MAVNDKGTLSYFLEWVRRDIVECILLLCAAEARFDDLTQLMTASSPVLLKKYLFYLIDCDLVFYDGQYCIYSIKDKGFKVLSRIIEDKIM